MKLPESLKCILQINCVCGSTTNGITHVIVPHIPRSPGHYIRFILRNTIWTTFTPGSAPLLALSSLLRVNSFMAQSGAPAPAPARARTRTRASCIRSQLFRSQLSHFQVQRTHCAHHCTTVVQDDSSSFYRFARMVASSH